MTGSEPALQIRAVLHIQWLSMKNSLRSRSQRFGLVISALVALLWYGLWSSGAVGLLLLSLWSDKERLGRSLPGILFFILVYWQVTPLLTASMGVSIDLRKMALYPIGVKTLFLVECVLRLVTGLEMILLLAGLSLGMTLRAPREAFLFLPAVMAFVLLNVLLSAGLRNLLERLLQRRRLREVFVFIVVMAGVTPQLILWSGSAEKIARRVYQSFRFLPQSFLPSTALARTFVGENAAVNWLLLGGWCAAAAGFGYFQFRRSFYFDFAAARSESLRLAEGRITWADRFYRVPARLLPDPLAALVEKELRYFLRSPRFRLLFVMGFSFGLVAWLPIGMRRGAAAGGAFQSSFLTLLSLYALLLMGQVTFLNAFGFDRSAARYFFWMPISPLRLLLAKNLVAAVFVTLEVMFLTAVCLLLQMKIGLWQVLEALGVTAICALYLFSAGNFTSVLFANAMSPDRVSRGGASRGVQGLVILLYPLLIAPVLAAYFARYYWDSIEGYALLLAVAAIGGLALYALTLPLAARMGYRRRERLLEELCRGEGPIVVE